jgi:hypothetical protein
MLFVLRVQRRNGKKLSPQDFGAQPLYMGHPVCAKGVAQFVSDGDGKIIRYMEPAEIRAISKDGVLIVGREPGADVAKLVPQSWWCVPYVPAPPTPPRMAYPPSYGPEDLVNRDA